MVDCILVKEYHSTRMIREIDRKQRYIFDALKVLIPKEAKIDQRIFDHHRTDTFSWLSYYLHTQNLGKKERMHNVFPMIR